MDTDSTIRLADCSLTAGWGAKVAPEVLEQLLAVLPNPADPEGRILHGGAHNEDAVIVAAPPEGMALVQTVDILAPIGNNPREFGRTAAANSLSDVYAMGGMPWSVMNIMAIPSCVPHDMLIEILAGSMEKVREAGAVLAGGHTLAGSELRFGLSVTGAVHPARVARNSALKTGDVLILTKPVGTGVLSTAIKGNIASAEVESEMYRWTTRLNDGAARVIRAMGLEAATDVTGFGLGGHALEMARGSGVTVRLDLDALPLINETEEFALMGLISAGAYANRNHAVPYTKILRDADDVRIVLAFDPQTSGGLLLGVPAYRVAEAVERLRGYNEAAYVVGRVEPLRGKGERLILA